MSSQLSHELVFWIPIILAGVTSLQGETFHSNDREEACASFHICFCLKEWARAIVCFWLLSLVITVTEWEQTLGFPWFVQCQCSKAKFNPGLKAGNKNSCHYRHEIIISKWESVPLLFEDDCCKNILVQYNSVREYMA